MKKTILVIEDDRSVARMLQDVLEAEGFAVLSERDGEWGLRAFQEKSVDLLIVDVLVPKLKGFDLIAKVRASEKGAKLPVLVISGVYRAAMHKERIREKHGVVDYLDKPIDVDRLIDVLHDVFSSAYPSPEVSGPPAPLPIPGAPEPGGAPRSVLPRPASIPPVGPELSLRGDLADIPFARLAGRLYAARASGALLLRKGTVKKIVYLKQGVPVFVKSNLLNECLGRIMVAERLITAEQCDASLVRKRELNKKQGEVLVEMGCISPHNLEFALELQMQTKLWDLFSWLEGKFQFNPKDEYDGPQVALSLAPTAMIYEGASHAMSTERIRRELVRIGGARALPPRDPTFRYQALELDPRATRLVDRIDGRRTVDELLEDVGIDDDDADTLVYAMSCTGLMELSGAPLDLAEFLDAQASPPPVAPSPPSTGTIELGEGDVEALSTGEINAVAALAKLRPASPAPRAKSQPGSALRSLIFEHTPAPEGASSLDARDFEAPRPEQPSEPPAPTAPPMDSGAGESSTPQLSAELRRQIRARLDAEVTRLAAERRSARPGAALPTQEIRLEAPLTERTAVLEARTVQRKIVSRTVGTSPRILGPKLDLEREAARTRELEERLAEVRQKTHYELLGVHRKAGPEELQAAFARVSQENHPERLAPQTASREARSSAEAIYLAHKHALAVLADPDARALYDRSLEPDLEELRIAGLMRAEAAFARGLAESRDGAWAQAAGTFKEAAQLAPSEGLYWAHLGWATFQADPRGGPAQEEALSCFERAVELAPRSDEVHLLRGTLYQKTGNRAEAVRDFEHAVRCNPDCVAALQALKTLEPPPAKKTGLLSRLNLGS